MRLGDDAQRDVADYAEQKLKEHSVVDNVIAEASRAQSRIGVWVSIINALRISSVIEIGVWKGEFAQDILHLCESVTRYVMVDPWQNLSDWNKPANVSQAAFDAVYKEAMARTDFAIDKREVLRDTARNALRIVTNDSIDFAYIDGDHTLRGITIDLINVYAKIKQGGVIGGDDFTTNIWQHDTNYDPTFVCPFAIYFAEAMDVPIYALPYNQFAILKRSDLGFRLIDVAAGYSDLSFHRMMQLPNRRPKTFFERLVALKRRS